MPLGITGGPCIWGGPAVTQRGVSNLLASLVEESKAPVWMGRETKRDICLGKESRRGFEFTEAAGGEEEERFSDGQM